MQQELQLRITLENPPAGVDFGIQKGKGNDYEIIQKQRSTTGSLHFDFVIFVKDSNDPLPNFLGPVVQGPTGERFVYIDIGTCAGQLGSQWTRRLKIPLKGITSKMISELLSDDKFILETNVPGTGKDGGPNCATVKPFAGWRLGKK